MAGAGRKPISERDPRLLSALDRLIGPGTRGDPETPLRWICKSTRTLARELTRERHPICAVKVGQLLHDQHFSLQSNRKTTTAAGLKVTCRLDRRTYAPGRRITNEDMTRIRIVPAPFHGEWNYTIHPTTK